MGLRRLTLANRRALLISQSICLSAVCVCVYERILFHPFISWYLIRFHFFYSYSYSQILKMLRSWFSCQRFLQALYLCFNIEGNKNNWTCFLLWEPLKGFISTTHVTLMLCKSTLNPTKFLFLIFFNCFIRTVYKHFYSSSELFFKNYTLTSHRFDPYFLWFFILTYNI